MNMETLHLYIAEILDTLLSSAVESATTPDAGMALMNVVPRDDAPSLLPTVFRNETIAPDPGHAARLGQLDLIKLYPRYRLLKNARRMLTEASAGGHTMIFDWIWANLRDGNNKINSSSFVEEYLQAASAHAQHAVPAWWLSKFNKEETEGAERFKFMIVRIAAADQFVLEATRRANWTTIDWWLTHVYAQYPEGRCKFLADRPLKDCLAAAAAIPATDTSDPIAALDWWWSRTPTELQKSLIGYSLEPVVKAGAAAGHIPTLEWVMARCTDRTLAAKSSSSSSTTWSRRTKATRTYSKPKPVEMAFDHTAFSEAVQHGQLAVLQWWRAHVFVRELPDWCTAHFKTAMVHGHVAILDWGYELCSDTDAHKTAFTKVTTNSQVIFEASTNGRLAVLEWMWDEAPLMQSLA